jgi:hypothetical protein
VVTAGLLLDGQIPFAARPMSFFLQQNNGQSNINIQPSSGFSTTGAVTGVRDFEISFLQSIDSG